MSLSTASTTSAAPAASHNPFQAALGHNKAALQRETEATESIYKETIAAQQASMTALQDENALLRAQLEDARRDAARAKADLQAARSGSAAMERQLASQQGELARIRPFEESVRRMVTRIEALEQIKHNEWPEFNKDFSRWPITPFTRSIYVDEQKQRKESNFSRTGTYIPTPEHWEPILAEIREAKKRLASTSSSGTANVGPSEPERPKLFANASNASRK